MFHLNAACAGVRPSMTTESMTLLRTSSSDKWRVDTAGGRGGCFKPRCAKHLLLGCDVTRRQGKNGTSGCAVDAVAGMRNVHRRGGVQESRRAEASSPSPSTPSTALSLLSLFLLPRLRTWPS